MFAWRNGAIVATNAGAWRKAQVRCMQSKETWTLWEIAQASESANRELRNALQVILLTRDGTVPLDSTCPSLKQADPHCRWRIKLLCSHRKAPAAGMRVTRNTRWPVIGGSSGVVVA